MITSSPDLMSSSSAAISSACVQEVVSRALETPSVSSRRAWHFLVKTRSPDSCRLLRACCMYSSSPPERNGRLKGISKESPSSLTVSRFDTGIFGLSLTRNDEADRYQNHA